MSEKDYPGVFVAEGGPAFPVEGTCDSPLYSSYGMTLRDWFAGQALAGILAGPCSRDGVPAKEWFDTPNYAYRLADAMLAARKAPKEDGR